MQYHPTRSTHPFNPPSHSLTHPPLNTPPSHTVCSIIAMVWHRLFRLHYRHNLTPQHTPSSPLNTPHPQRPLPSIHPPSPHPLMLSPYNSIAVCSIIAMVRHRLFRLRCYQHTLTPQHTTSSPINSHHTPPSPPQHTNIIIITVCSISAMVRHWLFRLYCGRHVNHRNDLHVHRC